jgi:hypothetical protein
MVGAPDVVLAGITARAAVHVELWRHFDQRERSVRDHLLATLADYADDRHGQRRALRGHRVGTPYLIR